MGRREFHGADFLPSRTFSLSLCRRGSQEDDWGVGAFIGIAVRELQNGSTPVRGELQFCITYTKEIAIAQPLRGGHGPTVADDHVTASNRLQKELALSDSEMPDRTVNGPVRDLDFGVGTTNGQGKVAFLVPPRTFTGPQLEGDLQISSKQRTSTGFELWLGETVSR